MFKIGLLKVRQVFLSTQTKETRVCVTKKLKLFSLNKNCKNILEAN